MAWLMSRILGKAESELLSQFHLSHSMELKFSVSNNPLFEKQFIFPNGLKKKKKKTFESERQLSS